MFKRKKKIFWDGIIVLNYGLEFIYFFLDGRGLQYIIVMVCDEGMEKDCEKIN